MDKILTIAVCAYNMEEYIEEALSSCVIEDLDKIEVLVMNDGSTDRTAEIADRYCRKYPESFRLVNKENGGWGSNVNLAISIAGGKYFKTLDADDWFETADLQRFVELLGETDADLVTSLYAHCFQGEKSIHRMEWEQYVGKTMVLDDVECAVHLSIWGVTYRLDVLKRHPVNLPCKSLYTDTLYILRIFPYLTTVRFCDYHVYNYRLGRPGQSVKAESVRKHYRELVNVFDLELNYFLSWKENPHNQKHMFERLTTTYLVMFEQFLHLCDDKDIDVGGIMRNCEETVKKELPELYELAGKRKFMKVLRVTRYKMVKTVNRLMGIRHRNTMTQM